MGSVSHLFLKCAGTVVLFGVTVLFGIIPVKFMGSSKDGRKRNPKSKKRIFIGLCNCFAGGVFFSTCLLDLLPLVRDKITAALLEVNIDTRFPLGEFVASVGFLLMLVTELAVHSFGKDSWLVEHSHAHEDEEEDRETDPLMHKEHNQGYGANGTNKNEPKQLIAFENDANGHDFNKGNFAVNSADSPRPVSPGIDDEITVIDTVSSRPRMRRTKSLRSLASVNVVVHSSFRIYILILALSLHSLFEGLSVGLVTDVNTLVQILIALLIHKSILSFALGVKLVDGELPTKAVVKGIILFASMAPIGMGLGLAVLSSFSRVVSLFFSGILQGIATGSFLYVTFFEILPEEFNISNANKGPKVLSVICGFIIIAGMCYYENQFHHIKKIIPNKAKL